MTHTLSRRDFLKTSSTALAGAAAALTFPVLLRQDRQNQLPPQPNLIILITDQERHPQHWPVGWADTNLTQRKRLADTGLVFTHSFCNSCMCSPSRSTLLVGLYPSQHGVVDTLTEGGTFSDTEQVLPTTLQNLARMLKSVGYTVVYKGKWHLSKPVDPDQGWTDADSDYIAATYGFDEWAPPDAGEDTDPAHFGGGTQVGVNQMGWDEDYTRQAEAFLATAASRTPFALIVSLVNPHDVLAYPNTYQEGGYRLSDFANLGIGLPPTVNEELSLKPSCHAALRQRLALVLGTLATDTQKLAYVNFYGYLQQWVDGQIGRMIDAVYDNGLEEQTILIRISDHGEMGLSHGGLRQKMFNVYEESIRVPLVISNPLLFPTGSTTGALASLVDLLPTMASIAGVDKNLWRFQGLDLWPLVQAIAAGQDTTGLEQDTLHFIYDDQRAGIPGLESAVPQPNHIRCIRDSRWKYALYFDPAGAAPPEHEMYDLANDPFEEHNLAHPDHPEYATYAAERSALYQRLVAMMVAKGTLPYDVYLPFL